MTPRERPPRTFGFAGDHGTGAELQRLWPAMKGPSSVADLNIDAIASLSWEEASNSLAALMIVPDTSTWSRSRHRRHTGPQPVRDRNWPWGLPWLSPRDRESVESQNDDLRQIFRLMATSVERSPSTHLALLHPEDLGPAEHGIPASVWQLPELKLWANHWGLRRYATHQCNFGGSKWPFPLGVLSTHPLPHRWFRPGWPQFDRETGRYVGPLSRKCGCPPGSHARDADYSGRHLRERPISLIQSGLLESMSAIMLNIDTIGNAATELSSLGPEPPLVRAVGGKVNEEEASDSTDAEHADLGAEELLRLRGPADPTGRASWDSLALRALGFQDFEAREYAISKGFTDEGILQKKEGLKDTGDQLDDGNNLETKHPEEQVKNKNKGTARK